MLDNLPPKASLELKLGYKKGRKQARIEKGLSVEGYDEQIAAIERDLYKLTPERNDKYDRMEHLNKWNIYHYSLASEDLN